MMRLREACCWIKSGADGLYDYSLAFYQLRYWQVVFEGGLHFKKADHHVLWMLMKMLAFGTQIHDRQAVNGEFGS